MQSNIFSQTPNWKWSTEDEAAESKLSEIQLSTIKDLPKNFHTEFHHHFNYIKERKLYQLLKTLPKGVIHHLHFDCTEDEDFYRKFIILDPLVHVTEDFKELKIGSEKLATENGWLNMTEARKKFQSEDEFVKKMMNFTILNQQEMERINSKEVQPWDVFESKITNFFIVYELQHIFRQYAEHVMRKYVKNGYDRLEFRAILRQLHEYDQNGNFVKKHGVEKFVELVEEAYESVKKDYPELTYCFVLFGLKFLPEEININIFKEALELKWDKVVGIDFVQQEDPNGSQEPYDKIADKVLAMFPQQNLKKVYHAGETNDHLNKNIQIAVKAGSVRIGHGINFLQHPELVELCKGKVCFEKNPVSNFILQYLNDLRRGTSPALLGLGIPVSISPDDPGKFGFEDSTADFFVAAVSYNWTLKHLKLVAIHSINHAICSEETKTQILESFEGKWKNWVENFNA